MLHPAADIQEKQSSLVFLTLIFINVWFGAPMIMVNVLSALQTIPQDQYEAAQIDGASKFQQFWHITVPHIKIVVGLLVVRSYHLGIQ